MDMLTKHLWPLGFKGVGLFDDSQYHAHFYAEVPAKRRVVVLSNLYPQAITCFDLSQDEYDQFKRNELGLVPLGCVSLGMKPSLYRQEILFKGDFKKSFRTRNKILAFLKEAMEK